MTASRYFQVREDISRALCDFMWDDYGFDDVQNCVFDGAEWVHDLAGYLTEALVEHWKRPDS